MAGTPPEYCIKYQITNISNRHSENGERNYTRAEFTASGNTSIAIGKITRIVFMHAHTSTQNVTWNLYGRLSFGDGSSLISDTVGHKFSGSLYYYTNTFDVSSITPEKWATWTGIKQCVGTPKPKSGTLYYRGTPAYPIEVQVYFWAAADLVDGAEPPTVSGITLTDERGHIAKFGNAVQGKSDLTVTGQYQLDPNYIYLTAKHTLRLTDSAGTSVYQVTQNEDSRFHVGELRISGIVSWTYTVLDSAGNSVSATGTFTVLAYSPPSLSSLNAERYITTLDDQGDPVYTAADDGENVRFSFMASVASVNSKNAWRLVLTYGQDGTSENSGTAVTVDTGTDGEAWTVSQDRDILTITVGADVGWWFKFTLTDCFTETSMTAYIDEASAYFNVEKTGISIGMLSKATPDDHRFEVVDGYESHFYGGIYGVTNYYADEQPTGGRWINGKPLYRRTIAIEITAADTNAHGAIGDNVEMIVEFTGFLAATNGSHWPVNWYYSSTYYCAVFHYMNESRISIRASTTGTAYVTILYTHSDDDLRTFWVYSAEEGRLILKEQVSGSVQVSLSNGIANILALAGETVSYDSTTGRITIGNNGGE